MPYMSVRTRAEIWRFDTLPQDDENGPMRVVGSTNDQSNVNLHSVVFASVPQRVFRERSAMRGHCDGMEPPVPPASQAGTVQKHADVVDDAIA